MRGVETMKRSAILVTLLLLMSMFSPILGFAASDGPPGYVEPSGAVGDPGYVPDEGSKEPTKEPYPCDVTKIKDLKKEKECDDANFEKYYNKYPDSDNGSACYTHKVDTFVMVCQMNSDPLETAKFWTEERLESALPYSTPTVSKDDLGETGNPQPDGETGYIEPEGSVVSKDADVISDVPEDVTISDIPEDVTTSTNIKENPVVDAKVTKDVPSTNIKENPVVDAKVTKDVPSTPVKENPVVDAKVTKDVPSTPVKENPVVDANPDEYFKRNYDKMFESENGDVICYTHKVQKSNIICQMNLSNPFELAKLWTTGERLESAVTSSKPIVDDSSEIPQLEPLELQK
jgi:hypothetical protein